MRLLLPGPPTSSSRLLTRSQGQPPRPRAPRVARRAVFGGIKATWGRPREPFIAQIARLIRRLLWLEPLPPKEAPDSTQSQSAEAPPAQPSGQPRLATTPSLAIPASSKGPGIEHQQPLPVTTVITPSGREIPLCW